MGMIMKFMTRLTAIMDIPGFSIALLAILKTVSRISSMG
jgi:hypothetical protein